MGVETGGCPHTAIREDASMNLAAIEDMNRKFPHAELCFVESGGDNLAELVHRGKERPHCAPRSATFCREGATIYEVDSSHVPMLSNPKLVIDVIRTAANA
jgi:hypothetical protein